MSILSKLIIAVIIAAIISQSYAISISQSLPHFELLGMFSLATLLTVVFSAFRPKRKPGKFSKRDKQDAQNRTNGTVKWFNSSKGFGFITVDNGEEIFVHFRSIEGRGRRVLRDGQKVTLVVANSEKGPQAEDVRIV